MAARTSRPSVCGSPAMDHDAMDRRGSSVLFCHSRHCCTNRVHTTDAYIDTREHQRSREEITDHCYTARRHSSMIRQEPRAVFEFPEACARVVIGGRHCEGAREAENSAPARADLEVGEDADKGRCRHERRCRGTRARARADLLRSLVAADRGILTIA